MLRKQICQHKNSRDGNLTTMKASKHEILKAQW